MFNGHLLKQLPVFTESWVIGHTHTTTPTLLVVLIACCKSQTQRVSIAMGWKGHLAAVLFGRKKPCPRSEIGFGSPQHQLWHMVCYVCMILILRLFSWFSGSRKPFFFEGKHGQVTPPCAGPNESPIHWSMNLSTFPLLGHVQGFRWTARKPVGHRPDKINRGYRIYSNIMIYYVCNVM